MANTTNTNGSMREKLLRAMRNSAAEIKTGNSQVLSGGGNGGNWRDRYSLADDGTVFLITEIEYDAPSKFGRQTVIHAIDARTEVEFQFNAGRYIENQVSRNNPNYSDELVYSYTMRCVADYEIPTQSNKPAIVLELASTPRMQETVNGTNKSRAQSEPEPEEEEFDSEEEEFDSEPEPEPAPIRRPSKTFQAIRNAGKGKPVNAPQHEPARKAVNAVKPAAKPASKPAPKPAANNGAVTVIGNGSVPRGRGRPPTGAVFYNSSNGHYLDGNRKPLRRG